MGTVLMAQAEPPRAVHGKDLQDLEGHEARISRGQGPWARADCDTRSSPTTTRSRRQTAPACFHMSHLVVMQLPQPADYAAKPSHATIAQNTADTEP